MFLMKKHIRIVSLVAVVLVVGFLFFRSWNEERLTRDPENAVKMYFTKLIAKETMPYELPKISGFVVKDFAITAVRDRVVTVKVVFNSVGGRDIPKTHIFRVDESGNITTIE